MKYRKGQKLYTVYVDHETGTCEMETYIVRTIRGGKVYATLFAKGITWVKLSNKHGDWGWDKNIHPCFRCACQQGEKFRNLETTKLQAWRAQLRWCVKHEERRGAWHAEHGIEVPPTEKKIVEKIMKTLRRKAKQGKKK